MKPVKITEIGFVNDTREAQLLRMWSVDVPHGKRPLQPHQHLNFEVMYVNSGDGIYTTAAGEQQIAAGDIFVFSCNEFHCITDVGKNGLNITNLQFSPHFLIDHSMEVRSGINIDFFFHHAPQFQNRIPAGRNTSLRLLFDRIREEVSGGQPEYAAAAKALLNLMTVALLREFHYADHMHGPNQDRLNSIHQAMNYINEHFTEAVSLQDIAAAAGLSGAYCSTIFKKVVGISLWDYVNSKRIDRAIQLIMTGDQNRNMIYIAEECGFNNTANFNKAFRKYTGMTPREYRAGGAADIS